MYENVRLLLIIFATEETILWNTAKLVIYTAFLMHLFITCEFPNQSIYIKLIEISSKLIFSVHTYDII